MSRLIETIQLKNGSLQNIEYHNSRMRESRRAIFHQDKSVKLHDEIIIPMEFQAGIFKCRVVYDENIDTIEFIPYEIKPVRTLKVVNGEIDYSHKFEDRTAIKELFSKRGICDDILVVKNGLVTDTSYCNIVFYRDEKWFTPSVPLLKGTKREKLLDEGIIFSEEITVNDIPLFSKASLINAMLNIEDVEIDIENIFI